jgi:NADP-dependent alcohol dehydrogenase
MLNFEFKNPTKIIFGKDQIENIGKEIPKDSKILMLYGSGSIKKNGIYEKVKKALTGFAIVEFGGIPANPEYEILLQALFCWPLAAVPLSTAQNFFLRPHFMVALTPGKF